MGLALQVAVRKLYGYAIRLACSTCCFRLDKKKWQRLCRGLAEAEISMSTTRSSQRGWIAACGVLIFFLRNWRDLHPYRKWINIKSRGSVNTKNQKKQSQRHDPLKKGSYFRSLTWWMPTVPCVELERTSASLPCISIQGNDGGDLGVGWWKAKLLRRLSLSRRHDWGSNWAAGDGGHPSLFLSFRVSSFLLRERNCYSYSYQQ